MMKLFLSTALGVMSLLASAHAEPPTPTEDWSAFAADDGVQRITIHCGSNFIDPRRVVVKAYAPVELTIHSPRASADQAFVMSYPGAEVNQRVGPGAARVAFHAGAVGRYRLLCAPSSAAAVADPQFNAARQGLLIVVP